MSDPKILWILILAFSFGILSCQSYSENSLGGDPGAPPVCGQDLCINREPSGEEMKVTLKNNSIFLQPNQTKFDIGGECYFSNYPRAVVVPSFYTNSGVQVSPTWLDLLSNENIPSQREAKCLNGLFRISVSVSSLTPNIVYKIKFNIVGYDSGNVPYLGPLASEVSFTKPSSQ